MNESKLKRYAVFASAAALSTWAIDMAATQVGLPTMQAELGISVAQSQWILNLTLMISAGIVTVGGALGDRLGRMRLFNWGLWGIIAGALITAGGGLVNSFPIVLVGRGLQGLGAGFFLPASAALLLDVFPMSERGGAQGQMMVISMLVTAFAPTLIGVIIQAVSWPITYLLTALSGAIALFLAGKVKYEQVMAKPTPFDISGSVLLFLSITLTYFIRQLFDMKGSANLEEIPAPYLERYAGLCGAVLARAHARTGDPAQIAGYLGKSDGFDQALTRFAFRYSDQNNAYYEAFKQAVSDGRLEMRVVSK